MPVPGPRPLGRGVVVTAGEAVPAPWRDAEVVTVDDAVLDDPADAVDRLHRAWWERRPVVVALAVDPASFRRPQSIEDEPWRLGPAAEPWFDRLHALVWANTYDARDGEPVWWWGVKAARVEDGAVATPDGPGDLRRADGSAVWVDGGPRRPFDPAELDGLDVVHHESVDLGRLAVVPAPGRAAGRARPRPAGRRRPRRRAGPGHRPRRVGQDPRPHRAPPPPPPRPPVRGRHDGRGRLQQAGPAGAGGPHGRLRAAGAHAQLARAVGAGRAPRVVATGARRARRPAASSSRWCPASGPAAPTPTRSGPTSRRSGWSASACATPSWSRPPATTSRGWPRCSPASAPTWPTAASSTSTSRSTAPSRCCCATGTFRQSLQRSCRHLLVDEFQDLTPAHVLLLRLLALPGPRRVRRRRRRPDDLRPRRRRPGLPHRLRPPASPGPSPIR